MYSSIEDLYRWNQALTHSNLFSEELRKKIFTPGLGDWSYGWFVTRIARGQPGEGSMMAEMRGDMPGNFFAWILRYPDRKSTRLNSSHGYISYAVFCLKKKKIETSASVTRCRIETVTWRAASDIPTSSILTTIAAAHSSHNRISRYRTRSAQRPSTQELVLAGIGSTENIPVFVTMPFVSRYTVAQCAELCDYRRGAYKSFLVSKPPREELRIGIVFFFFLKNTAPPDFSPLPLHDPLPI